MDFCVLSTPDSQAQSSSTQAREDGCRHDEEDTAIPLSHSFVLYISYLKDRGWIPSQTKKEPRHESRYGPLMCPNYHRYFDDTITSSVSVWMFNLSLLWAKSSQGTGTEIHTFFRLSTVKPSPLTSRITIRIQRVACTVGEKVGAWAEGS